MQDVLPHPADESKAAALCGSVDNTPLLQTYTDEVAPHVILFKPFRSRQGRVRALIQP